MPRTDWAADQHMSAVSAWTNLSAYAEGITLPTNPWFKLRGCSGWDVPWLLDDPNSPGVVVPPVPDWSTWSGPGQSVAAFMNALEETYQWSTIGVAEGIMGYASRPAYPGAQSSRIIVCIVADWMLPYVSGQAFGMSAARRITPPVWPGLDRVTLQPALPFYNGYTLAGPIDGLNIEIDEVPPTMGRYLFAAVPSFIHAGMVTFADDNGQFEWAQSFSFEQGIVCPRTMARAYRAIIKCHPALTGQVRSWTIDGSNIPDPFA